jgi:MFS family permease
MTAPPASPAAAVPARPRLLTPRFVLVIVVGLSYFLSLGTLLPVVPLFVTGPLGGDAGAAGLAVGLFSVGAIILRPWMGRISDRKGRKLLIVGGPLVVAVAVAAYHLVGDSYGVLLALRLLGGLGEAALFVGAGTMITDLAPEERRGEAISYWSVAIYGGLAFGPILGEWALGKDRFGNVWTLSASLALAAALLGLLTRESLPAADREHTGDPVPLLHRAALGPGTVLLLTMLGLAALFTIVPLYVSEIGMEDSGTVFLVYGCLVLAVRVLGARLPDRLGPMTAGTMATLASAAGLVIVAAVPRPLGLYAGAVVFAVGMSLLFPAMMTLALTGIPQRERGAVVGTVSSFFDASQALGTPLVGVVAAHAGNRAAFVAGAGSGLAAFVLLRLGIDPRARQPVDHDAAKAACEVVEPEMP